MTLDTRIYVHDPVGPRKVFDFCRNLIGATDDYRQSDDDSRDGTRTLMMDPGQGLPAWLMVTYRVGGPLYTPEQAAAHDVWCSVPGGEWYDPENPCNGNHGSRRASWLVVSFDTSYSYHREHHGRTYGCGDLHAEYVAWLGRKLDSEGLSWAWENEFTGEVHSGADKYDRLTDLAEGGFRASEWLDGTVLPMIRRMGELG